MLLMRFVKFFNKVTLICCNIYLEKGNFLTIIVSFNIINGLSPQSTVLTSITRCMVVIEKTIWVAKNSLHKGICK
jgi:hypothetical protein